VLVIVIATIFSGIHEVGVMIAAGTVILADLLLMFLYLEILAMVGVHYRLLHGAPELGGLACASGVCQ